MPEPPTTGSDTRPAGGGGGGRRALELRVAELEYLVGSLLRPSAASEEAATTGEHRTAATAPLQQIEALRAELRALKQQVAQAARREPTSPLGLLGQILALQDEFRKLSHELSNRDTEIHHLMEAAYRSMCADWLPVDTGTVPLPRTIPVRIVLLGSIDGPRHRLPKEIGDGGAFFAIFADGPASQLRDMALPSWLGAFDFELVAGLEPRRSSWGQELFARSGRAVTSPEVRERLEKMERALEVTLLSKPQSTVDIAEAEATALLVNALAAFESGVLQAGSILVIKTPAGVVSRNLSPREMLALERDPSVLHAPATVLKALSQSAGLADHDGMDA